MPDDPINILFITNRKRNTTDVPWGADFVDEVASQPGTPADLSCGLATVDNVDITNADGGTISKIRPINDGGFTDIQLSRLLSPANTNDILVFVHGTDNSFSDAIKRSAYNRKRLQQAGVDIGSGAGSTIHVIAVSWPSSSYDKANFLGICMPLSVADLCIFGAQSHCSLN